jgi:hypothetical protein
MCQWIESQFKLQFLKEAKYFLVLIPAAAVQHYDF